MGFIIVCGNGIAYSSIMVSVVEDHFKENKMKEVSVDKVSLMDCTDNIFNRYDLIVSLTKMDNPSILI